MERGERRVFSSIIILFCIVSLIFRGVLRELLFPPLIYFLVVKIGKHKVKDVRVPIRSVALNAFFDILQHLLISTNKKSKEEGEVFVERVQRSGVDRAHTSGSSNQSDMLSAGKMMVFAPTRFAATVFSRKPPIRRTLPVTVSSPVIARAGLRGLSMARDSRDVAIVMPAEGPIVVIRNLRVSHRYHMGILNPAQFQGRWSTRSIGEEMEGRKRKTNHLLERLPRGSGDGVWLSQRIYFLETCSP